MDTLLPLDQMSRADKSRAIDVLWNEFQPNKETMDSPEWHLTALKEPQKRYEDGLEIPMDLDEAEHQLRTRLNP
jgi:hypothetical protein